MFCFSKDCVGCARKKAKKVCRVFVPDTDQFKIQLHIQLQSRSSSISNCNPDLDPDPNEIQIQLQIQLHIQLQSRSGSRFKWNPDAEQEMMPRTNFRVAELFNSEIVHHSDRLKLVTWLATSNQRSLFQSSKVPLCSWQQFNLNVSCAKGPSDTF